VEPNTLAPYEQHVRLHLTPRLGGVRLAELRPQPLRLLRGRQDADQP
jgi:hypothetical protein